MDLTNKQVLNACNYLADKINANVPAPREALRAIEKGMTYTTGRPNRKMRRLMKHNSKSK